MSYKTSLWLVGKTTDVSLVVSFFFFSLGLSHFTKDLLWKLQMVSLVFHWMRWFIF